MAQRRRPSRLYAAIIEYSRRHRAEISSGDPSLSQRAVARACFTTQSAISQLESGIVSAQLATLMRYWRAIRLRVSLVFWWGERIHRVLEVGAAIRPDSPRLEVVTRDQPPPAYRGYCRVHPTRVRPVGHDVDPALVAQIEVWLRSPNYRGAPVASV